MAKTQTNRRITFIADPNTSDINTAVVDPKGFSNIDKKLQGICTVVKQEDVSAELLDRSKKPLLVYVLNVKQIWACLNRIFPNKSEGITPKQRLAIQLVGHAYSGSLSLGPPTGAEQSFPVLRCDTEMLTLLGKFVHCIEEVMLAGCQVAAWRPNGYQVNGRTLMFALAELWKCRVRGACRFVEASSFDDETGWYDDDPIGWALVPGRRTTSTVALGVPRAGFRAQRGGLPRPQKITASHVKLPPEQIDIFCEYFNAQLSPPGVPHLARRELEFKFDYGGSNGPADAALVCSGQFLEVRSPSYHVFYAHKTRPKASSSSRARWDELIAQWSKPRRRAKKLGNS